MEPSLETTANTGSMILPGPPVSPPGRWTVQVTLPPPETASFPGSESPNQLRPPPRTRQVAMEHHREKA